ncbi:MAG TPA: META domain-containing protein [Polyangiaceae bacterium]|nr:META domain-containing protein [Polyangiaceae bacterium]
MALLGADAAQAAAGDGRVSLSGSLAYQRGALAPESVAVVELREVDRADAPAALRAISEWRRALGSEVPTAFRMDVDRAALTPGRAYVVRALVLVSGRPARVASSKPIALEGDAVDLGTLPLYPASQPPPRALRCGDRNAIMRAGDVADLIAGARRWVMNPVKVGSLRYAAAEPQLTTLWVSGQQATLVVEGQRWDECTVEPFRARGNEPSWILELGSRLSFSTPEARLEAALPALQTSADTLRYVTTARGKPIAVTVYERRCADSMSGMPHPHAVEVTALGRTYRGCGGEPRALLQGAEWVVSDVSGTSFAGSRVTLNFGADGRAYGRGPCNPYDAGYELGAEGLRFSLAPSTLESCETRVMREERAFFEALGQVERFEIADDGALVLLARGDRKITARVIEVP